MVYSNAVQVADNALEAEERRDGTDSIAVRELGAGIDIPDKDRDRRRNAVLGASIYASTLEKRTTTTTKKKTPKWGCPVDSLPLPEERKSKREHRQPDSGEEGANGNGMEQYHICF